MPPPAGGAKKKKKGRAPKHQNSYAFRHNPKSKKTEKILSSPNVGVCRRCSDKIEWRKKYRKYKPRSQPGKCNLCSQKNVLAAYHTICGKCATGNKAIAAMEKKIQGSPSASPTPAAPAPALAALTLGNSQNPSSTNEPGDDDDDEERATDGTPFTPASPDHNDTIPSAHPTPSSVQRRRIRVCAICANAPALSKGGVDGDIIVTIKELEETLEAGEHPGDERRLTLRERKGLERRIEKLELELRQRLTRRNNGKEVVGKGSGEGGNEGTRGSADGGDGDEEQDGDDSTRGDSKSDLSAQNDEETDDDPFLMATGGTVLVGEDYQQMLLAREQQQ